MQTITKRGVSNVAVAFGIASAVSAVLVAAAPRLLVDLTDTTVFMTFWSAIFLCSGILTGLSLETTRIAATGLEDDVVPSARNPRVAVVGALIGLGLGGILGATAWLWGRQLFSLYPNATELALLIAVGALGFTFYHITAGALAGLQQWKLYSAVLVIDAAIRLVVVGAALLLTQSVLLAAAATAFSTFGWLALLAFSPGARAALRVRSDVPLRPLLLRLGAAALSTGASALLVIGFPTLLAATTSDPEFEAAAPLLLALTLTRAPLMIPITALQGVAITHFVQNRDQGLRAMWPIGRIVLGVGVLASVGAGLLGPWLLTLVGGAEYQVSGLALAGLTLGATGLALLTLTGGVCQAVTRHGAFVAGWLAAVAVALLILVLPMPLLQRAVLALTVGPIAGLVVHLAALRSNQ